MSGLDGSGDGYRPVSISALRSRFENGPGSRSDGAAQRSTRGREPSTPALAIAVTVPPPVTGDKNEVESTRFRAGSPTHRIERRSRTRGGSGSSSSCSSQRTEDSEGAAGREVFAGAGKVPISSAEDSRWNTSEGDVVNQATPRMSTANDAQVGSQASKPRPLIPPKAKPKSTYFQIPASPSRPVFPVLLSPALPEPQPTSSVREPPQPPSRDERMNRLHIPPQPPIRPRSPVFLSPAVTGLDDPVNNEISSVVPPTRAGPDLPIRSRRKPPEAPSRVPDTAVMSTPPDSDLKVEGELTQEPDSVDPAWMDPAPSGPAMPPRLPQRSKTITSRQRNLPPPDSAPFGGDWLRRSKTVTSRVRDLPPLDAMAFEEDRPLPPPPSRSRTGGLNAARRSTQSSAEAGGSQSSSGISYVAAVPVSLPPRPSGSGSNGTGDQYKPPPPPTRSGPAVISPQPRRTKESSYDTGSERGSHLVEDGSDEEENFGEGGMPGAIGLGRSRTVTAAERAIGEYPDSTNAFRRPPDFSPKQMYTSSQGITSYAVCGHKLCVGGHNFRVYDLADTASRPIFTIDLSSIPGFVFAGKDPKVTSMAFRGASDSREEGRYVWCGTSVGHIFEVDMATGRVSELKAKVHATAVTHIFRSKGWMVTLEENGRCHVFGPFDHVDLLEAEPRSLAIPARTIRTVGGQNYARLILNQLWSSTAPVSRSTTNAAGTKGPTIRVYDVIGGIDAEGGGLRTTFTSEWTGSVTAATILPLNPETVYLGHEGGYISVFHRVTLECQAVIKISPTDVLALEGVGEKLWAGYRSGVIQVYDVTATPWIATNSWTAHSGYAISSIVLDPMSISESGRFAVWSWARDALHAWDGLLSVEWIENRLLAREEEFCTFDNKSILVCSWNIGSAKSSDLSGTTENTNFFKDVLSSVASPDIIVFGLQEVIDLNNKKLTAKTILFANKRKEGKGLADHVSGAYRLWQDKLSQAVRQHMPSHCPYSLLYSESMVGLLTVVFVKASLQSGMEDAAVVNVKRGLSGIYGNKGAIVARLTVNDTSICFINVHLAAGQRSKSSRNADVAAILEDKAVLEPGKRTSSYINGGNGSGIMDHEMVILSGDLNYRIDQRREIVLKAIGEDNLASLLMHDQLLKEQNSNPSFRLRSFAEGQIAFAPTYKYEFQSNDYDRSEKMRIPAWCDRVLYRSRDPSRMQSLHYQRYEPDSSDHRPVSAGLEARTKIIDHARYEAIREEIQGDWFKHEADFLQSMVSVHSGALQPGM